MLTRSLVTTLALMSALSSPCLADARADHVDCSATVRKSSVAACKRLLQHGGLAERERFMATFNLGWSHYRAGANREAVSAFDAAERLDPGYANLYLSRALVHQDLGADDAALTDLDRYVKLDPDNWNGYYRRALSHRAKGAPKRAIADVEKALKLSPYARELAPLRVLLLAETGQVDKAADEAEKIVAERPSDAVAAYVRAVVLFRRRDLKAAQTDIAAALKSSPLFSAAHTLEGEIGEANGKPEAARASYLRALQVGGPEIDAAPARDKARKRLAALDNAPPAEASERNSKPAAGKTADDPPARKSQGPVDCRRYVPSARMTISVPCN